MFARSVPIIVLVSALAGAGTLACSSSGRSTGASGCLDIADGVDYTTFAAQGTKGVGEPCEPRPGSFECSTGLCIRNGRGAAFCSRLCSSNADCGALECKSYTVRGIRMSQCIPSDLEWCDKP